MSERDYLISKAERKVQNTWIPTTAGAIAPGGLMPALAGAASAPKGKKGRGAAGAGVGGAAGSIPGLALVAHGARSVKGGRKRMIAGTLAIPAGSAAGAGLGYRRSQR